MADKYKITYFNIKGLAESIRYILAYTGADFEDNRIQRADWPALKETLPYKKLPVLEVDGKTLNQSVCIARYLGQKHNLECEDLWTRAQLEALIDNFRDLQTKISALMQQKTPEAKKDFDEGLADLFKQLDPLAADGFFYGSAEPTWVDVYFAGLCDSLSSYFGDILEPYSNLSALCEKIKSDEKVSEYIKNRPESDKMP